MRKHLSRALITVLVLICPLSFSTDRVPDFKPACNIQTAHGKKATVTVAAISRSGSSPARLSRRCVTRYFLPSSTIPPIGRFQLPSRGRAPPLGLSLPS